MLVIGVCLLLAVSSGLTQTPEILETVYIETEDAIRERKTNFTIRDSKGYFYFFSDHSIQRFDGKHFELVRTSVLADRKENIINIEDVVESGNRILVFFRSDFVAYLEPSGLELLEDNSGVNKEDFIAQKGPYSLTIKNAGKEYKWEKGKVTISSNGVKQIQTFRSQGTPKFIRMDKQGNVIAAYSDRSHYVDNYFVVDTEGKLYDFSNLASAYDTAKDIYCDNVFYKWMICGYQGVKFVTLKRDGVDFIINMPELSKLEFGKVVMGVLGLDSTVLLSTEFGIIYEYSPSTNTAVELDIDYGFVSSMLGKMIYDEANKLWIAKGNDNDLTDLYFIDPVTKKSEHHLIEGRYRDLILNDKQELLLAGRSFTGKGQLVSYNRHTKKSKEIPLGLTEVRSIYQNKVTKQYYIGTSTGLYIYDEHFDLEAKLNKHQEGPRRIHEDDIIFTYEFAGYIIAGSNGGGLYVVAADGSKVVKHFDQHNGFSDPVVTAAITDDKNNLWVSTFNGLNVIDSTLKLVHNIYDFDGLPSREFNSLAASKHDGHLYFGTLNGGVRIDPRKVMEWDKSHRISVESITVFNKGGSNVYAIDSSEIVVNGPDSLSVNYNVTDYYSYPYGHPQISISDTSSKVVIHQGKSAIKLTNLKLGAIPLDFVLQSVDSLEQLSIEVQPDYNFWKRFVLWLISMLIISAVIIFYVSRYIKEREQSKTDLNRKISELQLSALQGQMNPHFIFNALGAIQFFIQTNDVNKADGYLSDFAQLMRGILDSSTKKFISLKEELILLKLYVGLEKARFEDKFDVEFHISDNVDEEILIPPMIIQPYIENAVNHGLHHLVERKGKLVIKFDYSNELLQISIQDNGIGRAAALKLKARGKHVSRGMGITAERINTINKTSDIQVAIEVADLYDDLSTANGTKVLIQIKDPVY